MKRLGLRRPFECQNITEGLAKIGDGGMAVWPQEVYQQTRIRVDEEGTEASAAAISLGRLGHRIDPPPPLEIRADHPFLFAIQEVETGTLLFLGRVTDPR